MVKTNFGMRFHRLAELSTVFWLLGCASRSTEHEVRPLPTARTDASRHATAASHRPSSREPVVAHDTRRDLALQQKVGKVDPFGSDRLDADGNDDAEEIGSGAIPAQGRFERVGRAPISLRQICDLTAFGGALYAAHALAALGADGATLSRFDPNDVKRPFQVAFDWNRPGEPSKGGGAGQGFLRVRAIDGRLYVPDADPPYNGFGLADWGTEGYVFVSNSTGKFASAIRPHFRPPSFPSRDGRAGASILPRAYHVFDVVRFRGSLVSSTGSVPPKERAWVGPSPGALHVANDELTRFEYRIAYPLPYQNGVFRLTYLVRFRDRLYAGIQDYDGSSLHDYVLIAPPKEVRAIAQEHLRAVNVTGGRGTQTLRWYADGHRLYWIAWGFDGVRLRVTDDGEHWRLVELPSDAGAPTDVLRFRDGMVVLTEWGLYRLREHRAELLTRVDDKKSPFVLRDPLCAAPLAVFGGELYAGGQRDGSLYRFVADQGPVGIAGTSGTVGGQRSADGAPARSSTGR